MQFSSSDFIEARKVSLTTLEVETSKEKEVETEETEILEDDKEKEYIPTNNLLFVRNMAFATREEEEPFPTATKPPESTQSVNEKLYEETMKGKEEAERDEKEKLKIYRG